jgi:hypothetical protein
VSAEFEVSPLHLFSGSALKLNQFSIAHLSYRLQNVMKGDSGQHFSLPQTDSKT